MGAKRKSYTPRYRQDAARLVIDTGRTIAAVSAQIGVGQQLLGRWVAIERSRMDDPPEAIDVDERAELVRLRREVAELRMEPGLPERKQRPSWPRRRGPRARTGLRGDRLAHAVKPPRYRRFYVDEGHGRPVLSSRQLLQAQPINLRYVSERSFRDSESYVLRSGTTIFGGVGRAEGRLGAQT